MGNKSITSSIIMRHIKKLFTFFLLLLVLCGCKDKAATSVDPVDVVQTPKQTALPFPTEKELESLGPVNDLDTQWFLSDAVYVVLGHPKRFMASE